MALTSVISTKELERIATLSYVGQTLKVMLCSPTTDEEIQYDEDSLISEWKTAEVSGTGYAEYSTAIAAGSYDLADGRYELPTIEAEFTCTDGAYSYSKVIIYLEGELYPHSVLTESPNISLASGQVQRYSINLNLDD